MEVGGEKMSRAKVCFFSLLFLTLTALKLLFPDLTQDMRAELWGAAQCDMDYTETLTAMGRCFAEGEAADKLISALGLDTRKNIPAAAGENAASGEDA